MTGEERRADFHDLHGVADPEPAQPKARIPLLEIPCFVLVDGEGSIPNKKHEGGITDPCVYSQRTFAERANEYRGGTHSIIEAVAVIYAADLADARPVASREPDENDDDDRILEPMPF